MNVTFKKIHPPRMERRGAHAFRLEAFVHALVDGHAVLFRERTGWDCKCDDLECLHIDAVADLIDPSTLAHIEAGRSA